MRELSADVIVVGLGAMGSATACELARRGARVLGLEQFTPAHDKGSSHGQTRIIRTAYYEHPAYVPMCRAAFAGWHRLEQEVGRHLLTGCRCLSVGTPDSEVVAGVQAAAKEHGLAIETLSGEDHARRFPMFHLSPGEMGVVEQEAGFLYVEECVQAHLERAIALGATLHFREQVLLWETRPGGVTVQTEGATYEARSLVLTAGPWAGSVLGSPGAALRVMRQVVVWLKPSNPEDFRRDRFPIFIAGTPLGHFYGLPMIDESGVKIARHYGAPELLSPTEIDSNPRPEDEEPVREFVRRYLPGADGPVSRASVCRYTLTPDRHFIIDRHPTEENVALAAGFSGHGFKFAPVVGSILADLALEGKTTWPLDLFRASRLG
jgi:sarcosine oxidase